MRREKSALYFLSGISLDSMEEITFFEEYFNSYYYIEK